MNTQDEGMFTRNYDLPNPQRKPEDNKKGFLALGGMFFAFAVTCTWIVIFCKEKVNAFVLPIFVSLFAFNSYLYQRTQRPNTERKRKHYENMCIFFEVFHAANFVVSIVAWFCNSDIAFVSMFSMIISAYLFQYMVRNQ